MSSVVSDPAVALLVQARAHDPQAFLGWHRAGSGHVLRVFAPAADAVAVRLGDDWRALTRVHPAGLFTLVADHPPKGPAQLRFTEGSAQRETFDPYGFPPTISDHDLHLFNGGRLLEAWRTFGAQPMERDGVAGVRFAVWAPNAERASVVGEFNRWDGRAHPMQSRGGSGVWELFVPGVQPGALYKFEIRTRATGQVLVKTDPYAQAFEVRPGTAARVASGAAHAWRDQAWMKRRADADWLHQPMSVYEVHVGSWRRHPDGRSYSWPELAEHLIPYVREMGYTHIELLPVSEHPLDESWGYQTTGYFAPSSRSGTPDELRDFVERCHEAGIGVLLDWVPGHFPQDRWALARFDGTALYEHEDPRLGVQPDWGTHVFNFGRNEVKTFLLASAHYWLAQFHFDGLRVDAVAAMLYLDYSRRAGEWLPNRYGGRENLEAIEFLRELNVMVHGLFPGALTVAEESTAWPMVSRPVHLGGLGFSMKWNMGWMNDTLRYLRLDPVYRRYQHDLLTFGQLYAYSENFVLPLSHDEVVHGKGSLFGKMPGDAWQKLANVRLLAVYQFAAPGKKLNFMGNEFAQEHEWNALAELDWSLLAEPGHAGVQRLVRDLNRLYVDQPELHGLDFEAGGFEWIDCHDSDQSVVSFVRRANDGRPLVVVLNFTPVPRLGYRIGVPAAGAWVERINSDSRHYGGSDVGNLGSVASEARPHHGRPHSITLALPPLAGLVLAPLSYTA